jgi:peptidoglycan-N-acetylglucosamine deacetylase
MRVARIVLLVLAATLFVLGAAIGMWRVVGLPGIQWRAVVAMAVLFDVVLFYGIFERNAPIFGVVRRQLRPQPSAPSIALTFDDGPTEPHTSRILDILKTHRALATFFVLGQRAQQHPQVVRRAAAEGHEIANHGWDHEALPLHGPTYIRSTIRRTSDQVSALTGRRPTLFRAPFGWRNPWVNRAARREGCEAIGWSTGVHDTDRPGADAIARRTIAAFSDGAILLLHDGRSLDPILDVSQLVEALPVILTAARDRGFRCVTVSGMFDRSESA